MYVYSRSYIKWFVWYNLHGSQSTFKVLWRLHYHTNCSYRVHKISFYRLFSLQQSKQNDLRTSCSSSKLRKRRKKRRVYMKPWFRRRKNWELYGTLLAELRFKEEYNYNILLRMTCENFEEIFQLIKTDIPKGKSNLRELILPKLQLAATIVYLSTGELNKNYGYEYYSSYSTMNSLAFRSFCPFVFSIFSSLITSLIFLTFHKNVL